MARIGEILGLGSNPFYQGFASNRNLFADAVGGMAANPMNPWGGFAQGSQIGADRDYQLAEQARIQSEQDSQTNATRAWLEQSYPEYAMLPPGEGFKLAMAAEQAKRSGGGSGLMSVGGHIYDQNTGQWISPPDSGAAASQRVSLSGQWGRDAQGNPVYLQPSDTGEMIPSQVPEGVTLMGPYDLSADRAAGGVFGKGVGGAQFDLPSAALSTEQTLKAIQDVRNNEAGMNEQFGNVMGIPQQVTPAWPGSPKANFQVANARLTNRAFLEAREVLRGGGQITDFESRKAEGAITNIEDAMARGDKALYLKALDDFEQAVRDGYAKLQAQAGATGGYGGGRPTQPQQQGGGFTILGVE